MPMKKVIIKICLLENVIICQNDSLIFELGVTKGSKCDHTASKIILVFQLFNDSVLLLIIENFYGIEYICRCQNKFHLLP